METRNFWTYLAIFFISAQFGNHAWGSPAQLSYQGRIVKDNGQALEYSAVSFLFQITDPSGQCVIYQEQKSGINMTNSGGVFDVPIGTGSVQYPLTVTSVLDVFNNSIASYACGICSSSSGSYTCSTGTSTYEPATGDIRKLRVSFHDGSGWNTISPDNIIRSVPFAGYAHAAEKLGNYFATDFLTKAGIPTCPTSTFLSWNGSTLSCQGVTGASGGTVTDVSSTNNYLSISNGTSAATLTLNVGTTANTVAAGNDSRITNALQSGATAGGDLSGTYPSPSVVSLRGTAISSTAPTSGQFFKYNGTQWAGATVTTSDISGLSTNYLTLSAFNANVSSATCSTSQTMYWNSVSGSFACQNISFSGLLSGSGTSGYVPYFDSSSSLANSGIYYTGSNVGIGTTAPEVRLDVRSDSTTKTARIQYSGTSFATQPNLELVRSRGTIASPTAVQSGDTLATFSGIGHDGTSFSSSSASMKFAAAESFTSTAKGSAITFYTTSTGTATETERLRISSTGNIGVGTSSPNASSLLHLSSESSKHLYIDNYVSSSNGQSLVFRKARGTASSPSAVQSGDWLGTVGARGYGATSANLDAASGALVGFLATENYTDSARGSAIVFETTNNLSTSRTERVRISHNGNVGIGTSSPATTLHVGAAPSASANYPLFALGSGAFDGTTSGYFVGNANGTFTGINAATGYTGDFVNYQIGGSSKFKIDYQGNITTAGTTTSSGNTTSTGNYSTTGNISTTGTGTITSAGQLLASSGTASTSSSTGALVVNGGAGISGALNVGSTIASTGNITSGGVFKAAYGTAAAPSYTYTSDTTTGVYSPSAGILSASTAGVERMRIDSSGNVGIGTTSPAYPLRVIGVTRTDVLGLGDSTTAPTQYGEFSLGNNGSYSWMQSWNGKSLAINPSGNYVGIGTSSPASILHIATAGSGSGILLDSARTDGSGAFFYGRQSRGTIASPSASLSGDKTLQIYGVGHDGTSYGTIGSIAITAAENLTTSSKAGYITFNTVPSGSTTNTERMRISSTGSVGIGTTAPLGQFTVVANETTDTGAVFQNSNSAGFSGVLARDDGGTRYLTVGVKNTASTLDSGYGLVGEGVIRSSVNTTGLAIIATVAPIRFQISGSEKLRIASTGYVGIGTTAPVSPLDLRGTTTTPTSDVYGALLENTFTPSATATATAYGSVSRVITASTLGANRIIGQIGQAYNNGASGTVTTAYGLSGHIANTSTSTLTSGAGINASLTNSGAGTVTTGYGALIQSPYNTGGGTITNYYGVYIQTPTAATNNYAFYSEGGTNYFGGKVGIGTTSPSDSLHLASTINTALRLQNLTSSTGRTYTVGSNTTGDFDIFDQTAVISRMRINSSGYVGIGNTSPSVYLHVGNSAVTTGTAVASFQNAAGTCTITPASSGSGIACSSDERLKENFENVSGEFALDKIMKLQAVTYNFKAASPDHRNTGYKAQEIQKIAPEFVRQNDDGYLQVYYDAFIPWLTESVKTIYIRVVGIENTQANQARQIASIEAAKADKLETDAKLKQLKSENAELKARLDKIERTLNANSDCK